MDDDATAQVSAPNERLSVLGNIRRRKEQIREEQILELPVPRWEDPEILVLYKPVPHAVIRSAQRTIEKAKQNRFETEVAANSDILINGCISVHAVLDGKRYSLRTDDEDRPLPDSEPTRFDAALARNLGLHDGATARQVVKTLFITEGDIIAAAQKVAEWSGYQEQEAEDEALGE